MDLLRLRVWTLKTEPTDDADSETEYSYALPMWQKHAALELETIDDFVNYAVIDQPRDTGDLVLNAFIESTTVDDDTDRSESNPAMAPYFDLENDQVEWEPEQNILITIVEWLMEEHQITHTGDVHATAEALHKAATPAGILGWSNLSPEDAIEVIEMIVELMFEETSPD